MVMDVSINNNECNDAILTMCDEGDNHNRDDGEDACDRWQLRLCIGDGDDTAIHETAARREAEAV